MPIESLESIGIRKRSSYRVDHSALDKRALASEALPRALLLAMALVFVIVGAADQNLGSDDALVGLAAGSPLGPLGQAFGSFRPELWPGRVALCKLATWMVEDGRSWPGSVLFPNALAAAAIGWLMARRSISRGSIRTGLLFGLCWFGSVGAIDHSGGTGLDFLSGLAIVAALDRLLHEGSDWWAGLWCSAALLIGGWPPLAVILLALIVIGRPESSFSWRLLLPPGITLALWTTWTLSAASPEVLAAGLVHPLTQKPAWGLILGVMALGLPFSPLSVLGLSRRVRDGWSDSTRSTVVVWFQIATACLIAGTIVPGIAGAARVPALAGILVVAAAVLDSALSPRLTGRAAGGFRLLGFGVVLCWLMVILYAEYFCLLIAPVYRWVGILALLLSGAAITLAWQGVFRFDARRGVIALALVAAALKLGHWGVFVPEWNYRLGEGPWGRAVGQWLLPNWPIYTIHPWPPELAFAIGRPVRELPGPRHLTYHCPGGQSRHVLLSDSEFEHWPSEAPPVRKVAEFEDRFGGRRVLARTEGHLLTPAGVIFPERILNPLPKR